MSPTLKADAVAKPAGQPPARIDMRAGDERTVYIDCKGLLRTHELLVSWREVDGGGLGVQGCRTRQGVLFQATLVAPALTKFTAQCDFTLRFSVHTTQGTLSAQVLVRVLA